MKKITAYIVAALAALTALSCTKTENIVLQVIKPMDPTNISQDEYWVNLRAWKESDHIKSYVYFAAWAPPEGATSMYTTYSDSKKRMTSLPDSLDIVNLWMGVPSNDPNDQENYSPYAWSDMQYCRNQKGIKFVMHGDASKDHVVDLETGKVYWATDPDAPRTAKSVYSNQQAMELYAQWMLDTIYGCDIDGVDIDYEGWSGANLTKLVQILGRSIGPMGEDPSKLLIVDYFNSAPPSNIQPYVDYVVRQAYSQQIGTNGTEPPSGFPAKKAIYCEQYNQSSGNTPNYTHGGYPCGTYDGRPYFTLEKYARDCVSKKAGGFGAYYIDNDYLNGPEALQKAWGKVYPNTNYPHYAFLRHAISIANPVGAWSADE